MADPIAGVDGEIDFDNGAPAPIQTTNNLNDDTDSNDNDDNDQSDNSTKPNETNDPVDDDKDDNDRIQALREVQRDAEERVQPLIPQPEPAKNIDNDDDKANDDNKIDFHQTESMRSTPTTLRPMTTHQKPKPNVNRIPKPKRKKATTT